MLMNIEDKKTSKISESLEQSSAGETLRGFFDRTKLTAERRRQLDNLREGFYTRAKSCVELPPMEMVFIDFADLLCPLNRNDQRAMQLLREMHSQLEQILNFGGE
jgi:RNAse (barnase) inhibitor barstar